MWNFILHLTIFAGNHPIIYWVCAVVVFIIIGIMGAVD